MNGTKTERNREMVRLFESGDWTLQEIGDRYGITRERVRQIVRKRGVEGIPWMEKRREERITECPVCGESFDPVRYYGPGTRGGRRVETCSPECGDILKRERVSEACTKWSAEEALDALIDLAVELGHTPRQEDLNDCEYTPNHMPYVHLWGSLTDAQEAAGLEPNEPFTPAKPLPEGWTP